MIDETTMMELEACRWIKAKFSIIEAILEKKVEKEIQASGKQSDVNVIPLSKNTIALSMIRREIECLSKTCEMLESKAKGGGADDEV